MSTEYSVVVEVVSDALVEMLTENKDLSTLVFCSEFGSDEAQAVSFLETIISSVTTKERKIKRVKNSIHYPHLSNAKQLELKIVEAVEIKEEKQIVGKMYMIVSGDVYLARDIVQ